MWIKTVKKTQLLQMEHEKFLIHQMNKNSLKLQGMLVHWPTRDYPCRAAHI